MGKRALRWLLGVCYVVLVTLLLLYQTGMVGKTRNSVIGALGTLFLGIALAVVLVLYIRVTDQMKGRVREDLSKTALETEDHRAVERKDGGAEYDRETSSYEQIYASFLDVTRECELSERELEVAWLLYRGYTNRQIGEELYIAETTVKKHVSHIYQKMEVYSRKDFREKIRMGKANL